MSDDERQYLGGFSAFAEYLVSPQNSEGRAPRYDLPSVMPWRVPRERALTAMRTGVLTMGTGRGVSEQTAGASSPWADGWRDAAASTVGA
jgi:hypothetical protein